MVITVAHIGITSYVFFISCFLTGFLRKKLKKKFSIIHRSIAITGIILSTLHAVLQLTQ